MCVMCLNEFDLCNMFMLHVIGHTGFQGEFHHPKPRREIINLDFQSFLGITDDLKKRCDPFEI